MYAPTGDLVRIEGGSREVQLTNNIFWAETGFDIYVADNSQTGFWSDYNLLHASGTGKLVHWSGYDFTDVLDWQEDVATFDLHSSGRTAVNPTWSEPRFRDAALDDFRTPDLVGNQRFSNPAIDAGDPLTDLALPSVAAEPAGERAASRACSPAGTRNAAATTQHCGRRSTAAAISPPASPRPGSPSKRSICLRPASRPRELDSQDLVVVFGGRIRSAAEALRDLGQITLSFFDSLERLDRRRHRDGAAIRPTAGSSSAGGCKCRSARATSIFRFDAVRASGTTCDSFLDARVPAGSFRADRAGRRRVRQHQPRFAHRGPGRHAAAADRAPLARSVRRLGARPAALDPLGDLRQHVPNRRPHRPLSGRAGRADLPAQRLPPPRPTTASSPGSPANSGINYGTHGLANSGPIGRRRNRRRPQHGNVHRAGKHDRILRQRPRRLGHARATIATRASWPPRPSRIRTTCCESTRSAPTHTLHVDAGDYPIFNPLVIANVAGHGRRRRLRDERSDRRSARRRRSTTPIRCSRRRRSSSSTTPTSSRMDHLATDGGTYGLLIHNGSTNFVGSYLTTNHAGAGRLAARIRPSAARGSITSRPPPTAATALWSPARSTKFSTATPASTKARAFICSAASSFPPRLAWRATVSTTIAAGGIFRKYQRPARDRQRGPGARTRQHRPRQRGDRHRGSQRKRAGRRQHGFRSSHGGTDRHLSLPAR